jgi:hypothetical protein
MASSSAKMTGSSKDVIADSAWIAALVQVKRRPQGAARHDTRSTAASRSGHYTQRGRWGCRSTERRMPRHRSLTLKISCLPRTKCRCGEKAKQSYSTRCIRATAGRPKTKNMRGAARKPSAPSIYAYKSKCRTAFRSVDCNIQVLCGVFVSKGI